MDARLKRFFELTNKLPEGIEADWEYTNHFEMFVPRTDEEYWWLILQEPGVLDSEDDMGKKVGLMMDLVAAAKKVEPLLQSLYTTDLVGMMYEHFAFSLSTFGPPPELGGKDRTEGNLQHILREIEEVRERPKDIEEWIDIALLALDGAMRNGATPERVADVMRDKIHKNMRREWPKHDDADPTKPIEHKRSSQNENH